MRLWHYKLLPYLPDAQFKGQLRELILIMHQWRDNGTTNHLLINRVMEYPKSDLWIYFIKYHGEYKRRYGISIKNEIYQEFASFPEELFDFRNPFPDWHNKEYLRVCMANLCEKHFFGVGKSRITDEEWQRLLDGYKTITGEEYQI
jgi:uncharacterized protein (TIGR02328 family)